MIVHGGWGGGWEWTAVARVLRERGHDVFTPTLTGMGEREHLSRPEVGLATHVEDVSPEESKKRAEAHMRHQQRQA